MVIHTTAPISFVLALSPIIVVLILMVGFRWGGAKAGPMGWLVALVVSVLFFGASPSLLAYSQMRGLLLTLYVLYVIWMALVLYNVIREAGAVQKIGQGSAGLTRDRVLQLLILGWVFSGFLQGVAGYGVPIAVIAPLLIGLGFSPVVAVSAVAAGHAWAVNFGSIAAAFNALIAASGMEGSVLAPWTALLLGVVCFLCGMAAAYAYEGWKSVRRGLPAILLMGAVMAGTQYLMVVGGLWNIASFVAGMAGLGSSVLVSRLLFYRKSPASEAAAPAGAADGDRAGKEMSIPLAMVAYLILIVMIGVAELYPPVHAWLNRIWLQMSFPATQTRLGWVNPAGMGQGISLFGHAGALLVYASLLVFLLYRLLGFYRPGALRRIFSETVNSGLRSSIGIAAMVGFALIMDQSGMTGIIATGLSRSIEAVFPFVSPFIGVLGAFMTGSNTNSNVVFAALQKQTAELLGLSTAIILAAQTTGGSIGGMLAPARIIVGCSTAGLAGKEGLVMRRTMAYGVLITVVIGLIVWLAVC